MRKNKKDNVILENIVIIDLAAEGKAIAKHDDKVIFVTNAIPGDIVTIRLTKKRRTYSEAALIEITTPSPDRLAPFCPHFGVCGGCKWQMLPYEKQLLYKQKQVYDQLTRLSGLTIPQPNEILASAQTDHYRNKLEFTFSNKKWLTDAEIATGNIVKDPQALGFHIPGKFDKILDISRCYLQADPSNAIRDSLRELTKQLEIPYYDLRSHEGTMRNVIIRTSTTGQVMVIVVFAIDKPNERKALLTLLHEKHPEITSLCYIVNEKLNDSVADQTVNLFAGAPYIEERMENLTFRVNPKSFYQTNSEQALELYRATRRMANLTGNEVVYDLYTGAGTIANFVSHLVKKVIGVEYVPEAIQDARINSEINNITNTTFYAGDMKDVLSQDLIEINGHPDVVILDPPRAGIHPDVARVILDAAPHTIVYVSCNPATQARDLTLFAEKYTPVEVQPVDMFPHTHHVENIVKLILK